MQFYRPSLFSAVDSQDSPEGIAKEAVKDSTTTTRLERPEGESDKVTGKSGQLPSSDRMPRPQTDLPMGTMAGRAAPAVPKCKQGGEEGEGEGGR